MGIASKFMQGFAGGFQRSFSDLPASMERMRAESRAEKRRNDQINQGIALDLANQELEQGNASGYIESASAANVSEENIGRTVSSHYDRLLSGSDRITTRLTNAMPTREVGESVLPTKDASEKEVKDARIEAQEWIQRMERRKNSSIDNEEIAVLDQKIGELQSQIQSSNTYLSQISAIKAGGSLGKYTIENPPDVNGYDQWKSDLDGLVAAGVIDDSLYNATLRNSLSRLVNNAPTIDEKKRIVNKYASKKEREQWLQSIRLEESGIRLSGMTGEAKDIVSKASNTSQIRAGYNALMNTEVLPENQAAHALAIESIINGSDTLVNKKYEEYQRQLLSLSSAEAQRENSIRQQLRMGEVSSQQKNSARSALISEEEAAPVDIEAVTKEILGGRKTSLDFVSEKRKELAAAFPDMVRREKVLTRSRYFYGDDKHVSQVVAENVLQQMAADASFTWQSAQEQIYGNDALSMREQNEAIASIEEVAMEHDGLYQKIIGDGELGEEVPTRIRELYGVRVDGDEEDMIKAAIPMVRNRVNAAGGIDKALEDVLFAGKVQEANGILLKGGAKRIYNAVSAALMGVPETDPQADAGGSGGAMGMDPEGTGSSVVDDMPPVSTAGMEQDPRYQELVRTHGDKNKAKQIWIETGGQNFYKINQRRSSAVSAGKREAVKGAFVSGSPQFSNRGPSRGRSVRVGPATEDTFAESGESGD